MRITRAVALVAVALAGAVLLTTIGDQAAYASFERKGATGVGRHARSLVAVTAASSPAQDAIQASRPHRRMQTSTRRVIADVVKTTVASQSQSHVAHDVAWSVREAAATTTRLRAPPLSFHS